jgi:hypothetical protein
MIQAMCIEKQKCSMTHDRRDSGTRWGPAAGVCVQESTRKQARMRFRAVWISRKSAERLKRPWLFHDSVPGHKFPAPLRSILRMFRKDARSRILADAAGIESWIPKGMCSGPVVYSIFGRVPSAQSHCCSADVCSLLTGGQREKLNDYRLRVPCVDIVFNQKQENVLCKLSCFERARRDLPGNLEPC